jgi:S1-C subfamily serine protease
MGALDEIQAALAAVAAKAGPSVVSIGASGGPQGEEHRGARSGEQARGRGVGSGVVIAQGKVLTNAHNVHGPQVTVVFSDGRSETAEVAAADFDGDLAVVSVDTGGTPPIDWPTDGPTPGPGTAVFSLSNRGGRGLRTTVGFVSSVGRGFRGPRGRRIAGSIEHTAPMARGSSGGPVVDAEGRFLALNTNRAGEGFYQALPADADLARRVEALGQGRQPYRPHLGIGIIPRQTAQRLRQAVGLPEQDGLLVQVVEEGSAAAAAGLRQGDYIIRAGGTDASGVDDLHRAMEGLAPGDTLELGVMRGAEARAVRLILPDAPPAG